MSKRANGKDPGACPTLPDHDDGTGQCEYIPEPAETKNIYGGVEGGGISLPQDFAPTPSITNNVNSNNNNYFPGTEILPVGEMRITFCGTAPFPPRIKQKGTCILVELGQGEQEIEGQVVPKRPKRFFFDLGPGSAGTITAMGIPFQEVDNVFFSHLHADHLIDLGYYYCFGAWSGRWMPLNVTGPDGRDGVPISQNGDKSYPTYPYEPEEEAASEWDWGEEGTVSMVQGMEKMYHWHVEAFKTFPAGDGYVVRVHQFHHLEENKVCYEETDPLSGQTVKIYHWPRVHGKDGSSAYRLEWTFPDENDGGNLKTLRFVWTGDGRPDELTVKYSSATGQGGVLDEPVDVLVSECQTDLPELMGVKYGLPPDLYALTIDTHHTVHYAVGDLMNRCQPRLGMICHAEYDSDTVNELIAGIRYHWQGMFALGIPDGIVVNVTKDAIWRREAALPEYGGMSMPNPDLWKEYKVYYKNSDADWKHETDPPPDSIPAPNPENNRVHEPPDDGNLSQEILANEVIACKYYPEEVNRPLILDWPEDTVIEFE